MEEMASLSLQERCSKDRWVHIHCHVSSPSYHDRIRDQRHKRLWHRLFIIISFLIDCIEVSHVDISTNFTPTHLTSLPSFHCFLLFCCGDLFSYDHTTLQIALQHMKTHCHLKFLVISKFLGEFHSEKCIVSRKNWTATIYIQMQYHFGRLLFGASGTFSYTDSRKSFGFRGRR